MPSPRANESKEKFISRCVPIVLNEGTAKENKQAVAMCNSMFSQKKTSPAKHFEKTESKE